MQGPMCHVRGITGEGEATKPVMLIGVSPGKEEIRTGHPRTGQAGKLMGAILASVDHDRSQMYTTNVMCYVNNKPEPNEIAECLPRLEQEIELVKPRLIIPMGNIPADVILGPLRHRGKSGKADDRGVTYFHPRWKCYVLPTWEPAAVLYSQSVDLVSDLQRDFRKIDSILAWPLDGSVGRGIHYTTVCSPKEAQRVLDELPRDGRFISVDIETTSPDVEIIDAESDKLLCIGIGYRDDDGNRRIYVLDAAACDGILWPQDDVRWTFQYGQFDTYGILRYLGVRIPIVEDTVGLSYCRDERPGRHSLKQQAREFLNSGWYEQGIDRAHLETFAKEKVYEYNAHDVAYTLDLAYLHEPEVIKDGLHDFYKNIFIPAANVVRDAQAWGICVDVDHLEELHDEWFPRRMQIEEEIQELAARDGFVGKLNPRSHDQLSKFFFQIMGFEPTRFSRKTKKPSTDKFALDAIDHPVAAKLRDLRSHDVVLGLVLNFIENMKPDGRMHALPKLHNTSTGRMAYTDSPLHGLPQPYTVGDDLGRFSEVVVASNDDWAIAKADYEQLEVWVTYAHTKDEQLLEDLLAGDIHSATAETSFHVKREDYGGKGSQAWDVFRQDAKKVRFGIGYGETAYGLSTPRPKGIGRPVRECQEAIDAFWVRYPKHYAMTLEWERRARDDGELVSTGGRKRRFPIVLDPHQLRQAINFPIQVDATDCGITSAIELHPQLAQYNAHILFLWHDAIVVEYPRKYESEVLSLLRTVMEKPRFPGFPSVKVEMKAGRNLGKLQKVKY